MRIVLYEDKYRDDLDDMLNGFAEEVFGEARSDVDFFIKCHWAIYLAIDSNDKAIGFTSFYINEYYGLRDSTIGNDYIYVREANRTSKAMYLFSIQAGKICIEQNLPLEHYYSSESSLKLSSKLEGKKIYEARIHSVESVKETFGKLTKKIRIEK